MRYVLAISLSAALAGGATAQTPADNDPMMLAYNYAYTRAVCDIASPKRRKSPHRTDATANCSQAQMFKDELKATGYWCVTNSEADVGASRAHLRWA